MPDLNSIIQVIQLMLAPGLMISACGLLLLGIQYFAAVNFNVLITIFFLLGMVSVLAGVLYAAYETKEGYSIIQLEVKIDE